VPNTLRKKMSEIAALPPPVFFLGPALVEPAPPSAWEGNSWSARDLGGDFGGDWGAAFTFAAVWAVLWALPFAAFLAPVFDRTFDRADFFLGPLLMGFPF
jgi:hypothetical protein